MSDDPQDLDEAATPVARDPRVQAALDDLVRHLVGEGLSGGIVVAAGTVKITLHDRDETDDDRGGEADVAASAETRDEAPADDAVDADRGDEILKTVAVEIGRSHGLPDDWLLLNPTPQPPERSGSAQG